jgi:hypothetical protein
MAKLTLEEQAKIVTRKEYAQLFGINYKTACVRYTEDCKEYRVQIITVSLFGKIYEFDQNDLVNHFWPRRA